MTKAGNRRPLFVERPEDYCYRAATYMCDHTASRIAAATVQAAVAHASVATSARRTLNQYTANK